MKWDGLLSQKIPRHISISGGSDAHGDFNFSRLSKYLLEIPSPTKPNGGIIISDNAFGKVRTVVYSPNRFSKANILDALKNGRSIVTDGPLMIFGLDMNKNGNIIDAGDINIGGEKTIEREQTKNINFYFEWKSTPEFGNIKEYRLIRGDGKTGIHPKKFPFSIVNNETGIDKSIRLFDTLPEQDGWYYYRVEAYTYDYFLSPPPYDNPGRMYRCLTNPIWIKVVPSVTPPPPTTTVSKLPYSVTLHIPNGGETWQAGTTQRIRWSAKDDIGITQVALEYSTDDGINWKPISHFQSGQTTQYLWPVPTTVSPACRVRVIAYDAAGNIGLDQSDATFTISAIEASLPAPTMYDPSVSGQNFNISWATVIGAQSYVLQEDRTLSFSNPTEYNTNLAERYFSNRADGIYYYRVSAVNTQGRSVWSNTKYVTVARNQPPGEITNISPANGTPNQPLSVTLNWNSIHPTGESVKYNVWFAPTETDFFHPKHLISAQQTGTTYTITNLPYKTTCSWRIEVIDETGEKRESSVFHFTTIGDNTSPTGSITINEGATTNTYSVSLRLSSSDSESGTAFMRFSNDGQNWSQWFYYSTYHPSWNLSESRYGGKIGQTTYTVYAQFIDKQGNTSETYSDNINKTPGTPGLIVLNDIRYETIKDAIAASASGDTVFLTPGVFTIQGELSPPRYPGKYGCSLGFTVAVVKRAPNLYSTTV